MRMPCVANDRARPRKALQGKRDKCDTEHEQFCKAHIHENILAQLLDLQMPHGVSEHNNQCVARADRASSLI